MNFIKYDLQRVKEQLDYHAISLYNDRTKYLITNTDFELDGFQKLLSINEISKNTISNGLFYLHFNADDEYLYHLDMIINNNGKFLIHRDYAKHSFAYANKNCNLALSHRSSLEHLVSHFDHRIAENICQALEQTKNLEGDYVEIGVYRGGSALTAMLYSKFANIKRRMFLLDTFDGFDYEEATNSVETHWNKNNNHHKLYGSDKTMNYINNVLITECPDQEFKLVKSNICVDSLPSDIDKIVIANIDVDMYEATRDAYIKVADKIVKGGIIIAEDPTSTPGLIGAFYAMEKFLETDVGKKFMKLHLVGQYFLIKLYD
jgi:hypothetical protein